VELLSYWKLRERPFEATWDTRFFYPSRAHNEALHRLQYLVSEGTMNAGMFTGDIGCGKTLTTSVFRERLTDPRFEIAYMENSGFSFAEILSHILRSIGESNVDPAQGRFEMYERLRAAVPKLEQRGKHLVVILDEAQEIDTQTLQELKGLTNFNGGGRNVLTILLIGQPELRDVVNDLAPLDQRIGLRFHLQPLSRDETLDYLNFRLQAAGRFGDPVFDPGAIDDIYAATGGVPRELNRVAKLALEHAWVTEKPQIAPDSLHAVLSDRKRHQVTGTS
jgi:general secretion pathway protein A